MTRVFGYGSLVLFLVMAAHIYMQRPWIQVLGLYLAAGALLAVAAGRAATE